MLSLQFLITAFVVVIAPGTGVIYTLALGLGQGRRAAFWAALGCTFGIVPHLAAATLGLAAVLHTSAVLFTVIKFAGVAYLLYLAWKIATAAPATAQAATGRPMTFLQAAAFQWVNPKVWAGALSAMAYVPTLSPTGQATALASAVSGINLGVCIFWTTAGALLSYLLTNPTAWRIFMRIMALALGVLSLLVFL